MRELFPSHLTTGMRDTLYQLYKTPFATNYEIADAVYISFDTITKSIKRMLPDAPYRGRTVLFYHLGYIRIPASVAHNPRTPAKLKPIIETWVKRPYANNREIADVLGLRVKTVAEYTGEIYRYNGFQSPPYPKATIARIQFYWYMNWFNVPKLASDADAQYKKVMSWR